MSAKILVPFDFRPASVAVKTASYTIPAGYYARVVASVSDGGLFTIGGVTCLHSIADQVFTWTVLASDNLRLIGGATPSYANNLGVSDAASAGTIGGAFAESTARAVTNGTSQSAEYWLPTGTVIAGSGTWAALVALYPIVS